MLKRCAHDLAPQRLALALGAGMQHRNAARQVIEDKHGARRHIVHQRRTGHGAGVRRQLLEPAHDIVGRITHEATRERHMRDLGLRARDACERSAQARKQRVAVGGHLAAHAIEVERVAVEPELHAVAKPDEGVTAQPLPALDALEQETRLEGTELHERRDRRIEVTRNVVCLSHSSSPCVQPCAQ